MRQFPNHNHRDCENSLSSATQPRERGRSGSALGMCWAEQCGGDAVLLHWQLPCCCWTNELFLSWTLAMTRFVVHPLSKSDVILLFHPPSLLFFLLPILFSHLILFSILLHTSFHSVLIFSPLLAKQTYGNIKPDLS